VFAPASGFARLTIRAPHRRIDLAVPHQVPLAELLPDLVVGAGEVTGPQTNGWMLRRADGTQLAGDIPLAAQGVRDGDVLYLVPGGIRWPEPVYDDIAEEIAVHAGAHGRAWDAAVTRSVALAAAGVVLATGLIILVVGSFDGRPGFIALAVALLLVTAGVLVSRAAGDGPAGAVTTAGGVAYAAAAAELFASARPAAERLLVAGSALVFCAVVGALAVGYGVALFAACITAGVLGTAAGALAIAVGLPRAAAAVVVVLVGGTGLAPSLAVRLGRLPIPMFSADPATVAKEPRPSSVQLRAAVVRADQILAGGLAGLAVAGLLCVGILATEPGVAGPLLGTLASIAMLLRSRLFPGVAARLPLVTSGALGLAMTAAIRLPTAVAAARVAAIFGAAAAVIGLLAVAITGSRRSPGASSPYLSRLADMIDVAAVVALAPLACGVLGLYGVVGGLLD
jgi:type VII secretion integral membrane protein EccD